MKHYTCADEQIAVAMTSSPLNVTSHPVTDATTDPPNQACYLLNSTAGVQLSYNSYLGATLVFVMVGLVGNTLSVMVFSSAPMRSFSSNIYLLTLAISDSFYLIGYMLLTTLFIAAVHCVKYAFIVCSKNVTRVIHVITLCQCPRFTARCTLCT